MGPAAAGRARRWWRRTSRNPIDALKRCFALTRGNGWAVLGLLLLVCCPAWCSIWAIQQVSGILFILAAGQDLGKLLTAIVYCALNAVVATAADHALRAAIYRALAAPEGGRARPQEGR